MNRMHCRRDFQLPRHLDNRRFLRFHTRPRCCNTCILQCCKNRSSDLSFLDQMTDSKTAHLFIYIFGMLCNIKPDPFLIKIFRHHFQPVCCRNVNTVDRSRIHDYNFRILFDTVLNVRLEYLYICKEKVLTEPVNDRMAYRICIAVSLKIVISLFSRNHTAERPRRIRRTKYHSYKRKQQSDHHTINST